MVAECNDELEGIKEAAPQEHVQEGAEASNDAEEHRAETGQVNSPPEQLRVGNGQASHTRTAWGRQRAGKP